jgi:hypothetical protein
MLWLKIIVASDRTLCNWKTLMLNESENFTVYCTGEHGESESSSTSPSPSSPLCSWRLGGIEKGARGKGVRAHLFSRSVASCNLCSVVKGGKLVLECAIGSPNGCCVPVAARGRRRRRRRRVQLPGFRRCNWESVLFGF